MSIEKTINEKANFLREGFLKRMTSPFYGIFVTSWILWNWQAFYITLFIDSELLLQSEELLKLDYIATFYPINTLLEIFYTVSHLIILPVASLITITFIIPPISKIINKKIWNDEKEQKDIKDTLFLQELDSKKKVLDKKEEILKKEKSNQKTKQKIKESKTQEELWDEEFKQLKENKHFSYFDQLQKCIYNDNGDTYQSKEILPFFHSNEIIKFSEKKHIIELTQKGQHFIKKYIELK